MAWVSTMNPAHGSSPQGYLQDIQTHKRFIIIIQFTDLKFNTSWPYFGVKLSCVCLKENQREEAQAMEDY